MHEQALIDDLVREIERVAGNEQAERVTRIGVRLGALSHMTPEHFREHFEQAAKGTVAERARVEIDARDDLFEPGAAEIALESIDVEH